MLLLLLLLGKPLPCDPLVNNIDCSLVRCNAGFPSDYNFISSKHLRRNRLQIKGLFEGHPPQPNLPNNF